MKLCGILIEAYKKGRKKSKNLQLQLAKLGHQIQSVFNNIHIRSF